MTAPRSRADRRKPCEVIDFDDALLDACSAEEKAELLGEARILARAFAAEGGADDLADMAEILSSGFWESEVERAYARKLSAALKRLARGED
jgi:hypothetical protein